MREWEDWLVVILFSVRTRTHTLSFSYRISELIGSAVKTKSRKSAAHAHTLGQICILFTCITPFFTYTFKQYC